MPDRLNMPATSDSRSGATASGWQYVAQVIEAVSFGLIVVVLAMRPLLSETYDSSLHGVARSIGGAGGMTPATTAWFDGAIWLAALAVVISVVLRRGCWRWTGIEVGAAFLLLAAVLSTVTAGNKRLAINASCDWLTAILLVIVLANVCRSRLRVALLLAAITASGITSAAKCGMQVLDEFASTRAYYETNKEALWQRQGIPLDDAMVTLYERRLEGREAFGFLSHPNTQGSWLGLAGFAALALRGLVAGSRWRSNLCLLLAGVLFGVILTTGSKGALAATVVGVGLWFLFGRVSEGVRKHWRAVLVGFWGFVLVSAVGVSAIGILRGGLPSDSLQFRWNYWLVTSEMIAENPWTGVGALNYGPAYLEHKPVEYPEEIKDPHNLMMAIVSQWGILGGVGLVLLVLGASITSARTWGRQRTQAECRNGCVVPDALAVQGWVLAIAVGFVLLRLWTLKAWWQAGDVAGRAVVFFDIGFYGLLWVVCFGWGVWLATSWLTAIGNANDGVGGMDKHRVACLCGILMVLLHNMIGFSLFSPGVLTPFAAMGALLLVRREAIVPGRNVFVRLRYATPLAVTITGVVASFWFVVIPVTRSSYWLDQARVLSPDSFDQYQRAAEADILDPTPLIERADLLATHRDFANLSAALADVNAALLRTPNDLMLYRRRRQLLEWRYAIEGGAIDLLGAIGAARQVVHLYPNSPEHRVELADLLVRAAAELDMLDLRQEAFGSYAKALALDAARPSHEIRRWSSERRSAIKQRLHDLAVAMGASSASSPP